MHLESKFYHEPSIAHAPNIHIAALFAARGRIHNHQIVVNENPPLIRHFRYFRPSSKMLFSFSTMALHVSLWLSLSLLPFIAAQSIQPSNDSLAPQASQLLLMYSSTGGMTAQAGVQPLTTEIGEDQTLTMLNVSVEAAFLSGVKQRANTSSDHPHQGNYQIG